jgi:acetyl-CoA carboxylase biotin carboxyl carrier protein
MKLTEDEVFQILKFLEESHFDELSLEIGDLKLHVRKGSAGVVNLSQSSVKDSYQIKTNQKHEIAPKAELTIQTPIPQEVEKKEMLSKISERITEEPEEGLIPIKSPMLGIFYRRPGPGQPPYVDIGTFVKEDDTVCLIEVMKIFNSVKAGVRGYIVKICAESGELVEYGQILFLVKPTDTPGEA